MRRPSLPSALRPPSALPLPSTPGAVAGLAMAVATLAAIVRTIAIGSLGAWVTAGDRFTNPTTVTGGITVFDGSGYDGQFFYRLALRPWRLGIGPFDGIEFDNAFRAGRIAYPALAWVVSLGGQPRLVPAALVIVNIAAIGVLTRAGARLAMSSGLHALWGCVLPGFVGLVFSFSRNLSEVLAAAAVFSAIEFLRRNQTVAAAAALAVAVLTREQAVLTVIALTIGLVIEGRRSTTLPQSLRRAIVLAAVPAVAFVTWQVIAARQVGSWPVFVSTGANTSGLPIRFPIVVWGWAIDAVTSNWWRLAFATLLVVVSAVVAAIRSGGLRPAWRAHPGEVLVGLVALWTILSFYGRTTDPAYFRQSYELVGIAWLVAWQGDTSHARRALWLVVPITCAALGARLLLV